MFTAMSYQSGVLSLIDQRKLPRESHWIEYRSLDAIADAIEQMVIRGAPAIGCTAFFALAIDAKSYSAALFWKDYNSRFMEACERLAKTRPTAVNLFFAIESAKKCTASFDFDTPMEIVSSNIEKAALDFFAKDLATCQAIGQHGLSILSTQSKEKVTILTHCNAGSLATAGYGTALGVVRAIHAAGRLSMVFADETRPFLQGARLTAFELKEEKIPFTLIADSAAAFFMGQKSIDYIFVGADRIASNGDTANKIGTYSLAVNAKHHGIPFYVAAPLSTFDPKISTGDEILIEERRPEEITEIASTPIAPLGVTARNPSFDVTPHTLISGIITEIGVLTPPFYSKIASLFSHS